MSTSTKHERLVHAEAEAALARNLERPDQQRVWKLIADLPSDSILIPGEFASRHNCGPDLLLQGLLTAVSAKIVEPIYTLAISDSDAEDLGLRWAPKLTSLAKEFHLSDGRIIDGKNPDNIRLAFRRTEYVGL